MRDDEVTGESEAAGSVLSALALDRSIGYKLRLAQILAYRNFEETLTGYGAAPRYLGLLGIVAENPGQAQNRLAEAVGLQKSSLVTILDRLEKDGILERKASPHDRRSKAVWLTPQGAGIVAELFGLAREHEARMAQGIDPARLDDLLTALDVMIANLRKQPD
ncbi:MarR family winged helix-turn-helix transcriptional regulator [Paracoccus sp. (in: a-proteobacteria)]|uniref:MarR family winged helix-turn-helix transcriptional regulator n=1 Tax=Paracoccus sp. TaxID=267 RepID=UPI003A8C5DD7